MDRVVIGNEELDLFKSEEINFNLRINTLSDVSSRNSSYSNTIKIPRTAKNERLLNYAGTMGNVSRFPYTVTRCQYLIDTTVIVYNGYIKLLETNPEFYSISIFDGIIDLEVALGNSTVADLDYSEYNHYLESTDSIFSTFPNTEGYTYAIAQFGKPLNTGINGEKLAPSVFAHTIWDKIFTSRGLIYGGSFFENNTEWLELIVPPTIGIDITEVALTSTSIGSGNGGSFTINKQYANYNGTPDDYAYPITANTYDANASVVGGNIQSNFNGLIELNITIDYTSTSGDLVLQVFVDGNYSIQVNITPNTSPVSGQPLVVEVNNGSVISFKVRSTSKYWFQGGNPPAGYFDREFTINSITAQINTQTGGTLIEVDNYMDSKLTQKQFVKDILQRYGLIMIRDTVDPNIYNFVSIEDLLTDRANAVDWTQKYIRSVSEKYDNNYFQSNVADYLYPKDVVPNLTGRLLVDNDNAEAEGALFTSTFEAPTLGEQQVSFKFVYDIPIWELKDGIYEPVSTTTKLMRVNRFTPTNPFELRLFGGTQQQYNGSVPYLDMVNMNYQYFLDTYYTSFGNLLSSYKEVEIEVDLGLYDYYTLDFAKLIYLQQTGRFYYIDSIKISQRGATAILIQIENFI